LNSGLEYVHVLTSYLDFLWKLDILIQNRTQRNVYSLQYNFTECYNTVILYWHIQYASTRSILQTSLSSVVICILLIAKYYLLIRNCDVFLSVSIRNCALNSYTWNHVFPRKILPFYNLFCNLRCNINEVCLLM